MDLNRANLYRDYIGTYNVQRKKSRRMKTKKSELRSQFICERRFRGPLRRVSGLLAALKSQDNVR